MVCGVVDPERSVDDLVRLVSHDIQNHLSAIVAFLDLGKNGSMPLEECVGPIDESVRAALDITDTVRVLYRLRDGRLYPSVSATSLNEVVELAVDTVNQAAVERAIDIHVDIPRDTAVIADAVLLTNHVLVRLLREALRNTTKESEIWFSAEKVDGAVALSMTVEGGQLWDEIGGILEDVTDTRSEVEGARRIALVLVREILDRLDSHIDGTKSGNKTLRSEITVRLPAAE